MKSVLNITSARGCLQILCKLFSATRSLTHQSVVAPPGRSLRMGPLRMGPLRLGAFGWVLFGWVPSDGSLPMCTFGWIPSDHLITFNFPLVTPLFTGNINIKCRNGMSISISLCVIQIDGLQPPL